MEGYQERDQTPSVLEIKSLLKGRRKLRMVYDCFPFFNELDILKLRLAIMDPFVDRFVMEESDVTFSGEPKEMIFASHREEFAPWLDKIIYIPVTDCPKGLAPHDMDHWQKDHLLEGLRECEPDDVILFSDVDEIPNPDILPGLMADMQHGAIYHLAQRMFYCFLNVEEVSGKLLSYSGDFEDAPRPMWLGTKLFFYDSLKGRGFWDLRTPEARKEDGIRVADGGWHFGYMGGAHETDLAKRVGDKVQAAAHQEYNETEILVQIADRIRTGQDIFGREAAFVRVEVDETYPAYLREHMDQYDYLLMPSYSGMQIACIKAGMRIKRIFRKVLRKVKRIAGKA